jgi:predicted ferric reductase
MELEGPDGAFTLPDDLEQVVLITGGVGITCVRSILRYLADRQSASGGMRLAPSCRPFPASERSTPHDQLAVSMGQNRSTALASRLSSLASRFADMDCVRFAMGNP